MRACTCRPGRREAAGIREAVEALFAEHGLGMRVGNAGGGTPRPRTGAVCLPRYASFSKYAWDRLL